MTNAERGMRSAELAAISCDQMARAYRWHQHGGGSLTYREYLRTRRLPTPSPTTNQAIGCATIPLMAGASPTAVPQTGGRSSSHKLSSTGPASSIRFLLSWLARFPFRQTCGQTRQGAVQSIDRVARTGLRHLLAKLCRSSRDTTLPTLAPDQEGKTSIHGDMHPSCPFNPQPSTSEMRIKLSRMQQHGVALDFARTIHAEMLSRRNHRVLELGTFKRDSLGDFAEVCAAIRSIRPGQERKDFTFTIGWHLKRLCSAHGTTPRWQEYVAMVEAFRASQRKVA